MSLSLTQADYVEGVSQILLVLKSQKRWWDCCTGPNQATGLSSDELLALLEADETNTIAWSEQLLSQMLLWAKRHGTVRKSNGYFINCNMLAENAINKQFLLVIPGLTEPQWHANSLVIY